MQQQEMGTGIYSINYREDSQDATRFLICNEGGSAPIAEFLLKHFVGESAANAGKGLVEIAATVVSDGSTQVEATLRFDELSYKVVKRLQPLFRDLPDNSAKAITAELGTTLGQSLSVEFLPEKDLDPGKLATAFKQARPLPQAFFGEAETALYDRAHEGSVRYMVGIANKLPRFEPAAFGTILARLGRMGEEFEQLLQSIARIEDALSAGKDEAAARANRFEADYRQAVMRNLDFLELFGADISEEARRQRLSVGYISLTISKPDAQENRETVSADRLFLTLGGGSGRILIRGEAGSGKSTLLRWVAIGSAAFSPRGSVSVNLKLAGLERVLRLDYSKIVDRSVPDTVPKPTPDMKKIKEVALIYDRLAANSSAVSTLSAAVFLRDLSNRAQRNLQLG